MLNTWIHDSVRAQCPYCFSVIDVSEHSAISEEVKRYIARYLLHSLRPLESLKSRFKNKPKTDLEAYLKEKVLVPPSATDQPSLNTKQGDCGEILSTLILVEMRQMSLPICKLRYKANNKRAMLGTDIFGIHFDSKTGNIVKLVYGEVKTRRTYDKTVAVEAFNGVYLDQGQSLSNIIDFVILRLEEKEEYALASKLASVLDDLDRYNKDFEIFLLVEKSIWKEEILDTLHQKGPSLTNLCLNVLLIDGLKTFVDELNDLAVEEGVTLVYG